MNIKANNISPAVSSAYRIQKVGKHIEVSIILKDGEVIIFSFKTTGDVLSFLNRISALREYASAPENRL